MRQSTFPCLMRMRQIRGNGWACPVLLCHFLSISLLVGVEMIHCLRQLMLQGWLGSGSSLPPRQGTVWVTLVNEETLLLLCSCCNGFFGIQCSDRCAQEPGSSTGSSVPLGAPAAPAVTPLARALGDSGVLMAFPSEVLPQPSCISGPELLGVW